MNARVRSNAKTKTAVKDWKNLKRHRLSAEYEDLAGEDFEDYVENLDSVGNVTGRNVILHEGEVIDGWQFHRASVRLNKKPKFATLPANVDPRLYVATVNDRRRHESPKAAENRIAKRRERVIAARREGLSTRAIAKQEGVSQKTILNDLGTSGDDPSSPEVITGLDDKKYRSPRNELLEASKPTSFPLDKLPTRKTSADQTTDEGSEAEERTGPGDDFYAQGEPGADEPAHDELGRPAKKRPPRKVTPKNVVFDKTGQPVPDQCRDAFADIGLPGLIEELDQIAKFFTPEPWATKAGKLTVHYGFILIDKFKEHIYEALSELQLAIEALRAGIPYAVCPTCNAVDSKKNGKCCSICHGYGHVPETRFLEIQGEKGPV